MPTDIEQKNIKLSDVFSKWKNYNEIWPLTGWIVSKLDNNRTKIAELFEMDSETKVEFFSWGHNSCYSNVFNDYLKDMLKNNEGHVLDILRKIEAGN